ncbi:hypothetical protein Bra3105_12745 [Brachybacterium halotolerans subsp. kimchii]|uniref:hypothetical protein n=1 Tax=Brachybacterium halotolerans TaxID=2795215 RepID=UPI001E2DDD20|nr:hypothetical protein [Brachybacterium halotolerans]UEJ81706.1 hypothetical protein Bra3105_12745 [Brachybacterium halotolerans subsp. kimchii]
MSSGYSPVVPHPRPVPWGWTLAEALLGAGAAATMLGLFPLGLLARTIMCGALVIAIVLIDGFTRMLCAGSGLERSMRQLVVGGLTLLIIVLAVTAMPLTVPSPARWALVAATAVGLFVELRWDKRVQVERAQAIAAQQE